jgi:ATP-binding cassette, subfamily B, bacterial PglK
MIKMIIEFFSLLTSSQRKRFYLLQVMVVIMTFTEIAGIASIAPFMALVGDLTILERDNLLATLYLKSNLGNPYEFIFYLGFIVLATLATATIVSMYVSWRLSMFATKFGAEIADRLYSYYLGQSWLFHTMGSSSNLTKKIANETMRVTGGILLPLMTMNARVLLTLSIALIMLFYDPFVAIIGLLFFTLSYVVLFKFVRTRLQRNGENISTMYAERFKLMNEGFGGIKDVLLLGRSGNFKKLFLQTGNRLAYSQGTNVSMTQVPRYFMEFMAFGSMISLVLYLVKNYQGNLGLILPILSVYALAGMKLLPALQQIYGSLATVKGNLSAYESIRDDLKNITAQTVKKVEANHQCWSKHNEISLKEITFSYPGKDVPAIESVSLTIQPNSVVGFVGPSGSGKSTIIDIIVGLIPPQQGEVIIDGVPLIKQNLRAWQDKIGFVPQAMFLTEGSVAENVAFGIPQDLIDYVQVKKALKLAHMEEFVSELELGVYSKVGERGAQLSGGQRQRLGIARALYHEADVLVFDEATSALDGITEKIIMDSIHDCTGQKTLIMIAHRLKTVKKCDQIFVMEKGRVVDSGTYQHLLETNELFKKMSSHA